MKKVFTVILVSVFALAFVACGPSAGQVELEKLYKDFTKKTDEATKAVKDAKIADDALKAIEKGIALPKDLADKKAELVKKFADAKDSDATKKVAEDLKKAQDAFGKEKAAAKAKYEKDKKFVDALEKLEKPVEKKADEKKADEKKAEKK
ncbi:MAG: hypothetical protein EPN93_19960 [Spirochaetes bacterium]|nr:MAG: hypothetical protein EPN93_19960 [Spirochaetota bacterium]